MPVHLRIARRRQRAEVRGVGVVERPAAHERVARIQPIVDAHMPLIPIIHIGDLADVVARGIGVVRQRNRFEQLQRNRVDAIRGNLVVRERLTAIRGRVVGERIEDRRLAREVAAALRGGGHDAADGLTAFDAAAFEVAEEERLVLHDRTAEAAAELAEAERRLFGVEEVLGVERVVAQELVGDARIAVRARLDLQIDDGAGGAAELRGVVAGLDAELFDRLGGRHDHGEAEEERVVVDAVEHPVVLIGALAVRADRHAALARRHGARARRPFGGAGDEQAELNEVAPVQRQAAHLFLVDDLADRRGLGIDDRTLGDDVHGLGDVAEREREVDARDLIDVERHGRLHDPLEAGQLGGHFIAADRHVGNEVVALVVADHLLPPAGIQVDGGDGGPGHDRAGAAGFGDGADQAAGGALTEGGRGGGEAAGQTAEKYEQNSDRGASLSHESLSSELGRTALVRHW